MSGLERAVAPGAGHRAVLRKWYDPGGLLRNVVIRDSLGCGFLLVGTT
jgi:hypothetical protein